MLLSKLNHYGGSTTGAALIWLSNDNTVHAETQYVANDRVLRIRMEVPQGSILGPLLF